MSEAERLLAIRVPLLGTPIASRRLRIRLAPAAHQAVLDRISDLCEEDYPQEQTDQKLRAWELFILRELRDHDEVRADLVLWDFCKHWGRPYDLLSAEQQLQAQHLLVVAWLRVAQWVTTSSQLLDPSPQSPSDSA